MLGRVDGDSGDPCLGRQSDWFVPPVPYQLGWYNKCWGKVNFFHFFHFLWPYYWVKLALACRLLKTTYHKKHGADRICFTHHPSSILCSSRYNIESTNGVILMSPAFYQNKLFQRNCSLCIWLYTSYLTESLRYLSLYDNRCLRYFKGHKQR